MDQEWETSCPQVGNGGGHCNCWYDELACCYCNAPAITRSDEPDDAGNEADNYIYMREAEW